MVERFSRQLLIWAAIALGGCAGMHQGQNMPKQWIIDEDFSAGMDNWWVEGGEEVRVEQGRLVIRADNPAAMRTKACTVWCKTPHPGEYVLELDARVLASSIQANNINLFLCFSDPGGTPLYETRGDRSAAEYGKYHQLSGNIITFLNDHQGEAPPNVDGTPKARVRIRRCPGFELLSQAYSGRCQIGETYRIKVTRSGGWIVLEVNGREMHRTEDRTPLGPGLLGLRTFRTELWFDNIKLRAID